MTDESAVAPVRERVRPTVVPELPPTDTAPSELAAIMSQVSATMGPNVVRKATAMPGFKHIETGIFILDLALLGGIPEGLTTMFIGWESTGKSTLAMRVAGRMQKKYPQKSVVFVDFEQTMDLQWGKVHGIDGERLLYVQPETGEQGVDIIDAMLQTDEVSLVIVDSLPSIVPFKELEDSAEDAIVAIRARLVGRLCSKIIGEATKLRNRTGFTPTVILINQWRNKIGVTKGDNRSMPGGNQPKFLATTIVETRNKEILKPNSQGLEIVAYNEHAFTIRKCKVGNSVRNVEFKMIRDPEHYLGAGAIDESRQVVTYAKKFGLVSGGGSSWRIDGVDQKFGKMDEVAQFLEETPAEMVDLQRRCIMVVRQSMGLLPLPQDNYLLGYAELVD